MNMFSGMNISATGMSAEQERMEAAAENLSIAHVSRRPDDPMVPMAEVTVREAGTIPGADPQFSALMAGTRGSFGVESEKSTPAAPVRLEFDPHHPQANAAGYVAYPDVNVLHEMTSMMSAQNYFNANVTAYGEARSMLQRAIDIGRA